RAGAERRRLGGGRDVGRRSQADRREAVGPRERLRRRRDRPGDGFLRARDRGAEAGGEAGSEDGPVGFDRGERGVRGPGDRGRPGAGLGSGAAQRAGRRRGAGASDRSERSPHPDDPRLRDAGQEGEVGPRDPLLRRRERGGLERRGGLMATATATRPAVVVGAGTMGSGIAQVFAASGRPVLLLDPVEAALKKGLGVIEKSLGRLADKGTIDSKTREETLRRISTQESGFPLAECAIAVEAVPERLDLKKSVFQMLDQKLPPGAILATN